MTPEQACIKIMHSVIINNFFKKEEEIKHISFWETNTKDIS